jgi:hypothetical protein
MDNYLLATKNNKMPYTYCFASMHFIFEGYGDLGYDSHTYVHETGHALGLYDYYSTRSGSRGGNDSYPFAGADMMDFNVGDHCSFSKYMMGWISPKAVISEPGEYRLKSSNDTGEFFIVSNSFAGRPFDEYFIVEYITPTGLNYMDSKNPYAGNGFQLFTKPGIRISHIDNRGVRLINTGKTYVFDHETNFRNIEGVIITNSTRESIYKISENNYCRQNVIMHKNFTTFETSVLSEDFAIGQKMNDLLWYENETFTLLGNSKYRELMPTKTNLLDKGVEFNFSIKVNSIGEEAVISVY